MNVGDDFPGVLETNEDNVLYAILHIGHALPRNGNRLRVSEPVLDDADVVRCEIPQCIDIGANAAQIKALAINVADFS